MSFERARRVADAVLYEGYVLYPYRASAAKNRLRWQFGVVAPRAWSEGGGSEAWWMQATCLAEAGRSTAIDGRLRFLRVRRRSVEQANEEGTFEAVEALEAAGELWTTWDEGVEAEIPFALDLARAAGETVIPFLLPASRAEEPIGAGDGGAAGRLVREERPLEGRIHVAVDTAGAFRTLRVRVENVSRLVDGEAPRDEALRFSFLGTHVLLGITGGAFLSLADPPEEAREAAASCRHVGLWPALAGEPGERDVVLCSPIILEDHPRLAPESPGDFFDATEIDEMLTLRIMTLTDEEKREARATDARVAGILDRVDAMPPEMLERLHGAIRDLRVAGTGVDAGAAEAHPVDLSVPWWDPAADASVSPSTDTIEVAGRRVARGSRVRLRPGRGADAQDMFLEGRTARVEGVFLDVDDRRYLAVTLEEDPAAELQQWHGRYLYFRPEEVEPLGEPGA